MQIKDLPASSVLNADDVLAKDTNGVTTEKINGANLAAAVKLLASLLGVSDVVNSLISTSTTAPLAAAQGKALNEAKLDNANVYNGLDKTASGYALDARQGKALNDAKANASDIAIIIDGNQTTHTGGAAIGEFVLVRNSTISNCPDGLYMANQAISANTPIDSSYLTTAVDGGGLNDLNNKLTSLNSHIAKEVITITKETSTVLNNSFCRKSGYVITISFDMDITTSTAGWNKIASIPSDYAPPKSMFIPLINTDNINYYVCYIDTSGNIYVKTALSNVRVRGVATWVM